MTRIGIIIGSTRPGRKAEAVAQWVHAIDYLFREWNNKAAGFVGYGSAGGVRAVEHLRLIMGEVMVADVRAQVQLSLFMDFENYTRFTPHERHTASVNAMLDQVVSWSNALKTVRGQ
jgi:NAD(P)H-dependent FMN reductase